MSLEKALNRLAEAIEAQTAALGSVPTETAAAAPEPASAEKEEAPVEEKPKAEKKTTKKKAEKKAAKPKKLEDNPAYVDMAGALTQLIDVNRDAVVEILEEYGVKRATDAPEEKWPEITAKFQAALNDGGADEEAEEGDLI